MKLQHVALIIVFVIAIVGFGLQGSESIPSNALLYVNENAGKYISPPCKSDSRASQFDEAMTWREATQKGFEGADWCADRGGFTAPPEPLLKSLLWPDEPRWDSKGRWNF